MKQENQRYSYKEYIDGGCAVYKDGLWQCVIEEGIERAKEIFETDKETKTETLTN